MQVMHLHFFAKFLHQKNLGGNVKISYTLVHHMVTPGAKIHRQESTDHDKKQFQTIHELNGFNEGLTRPFWSS